jgi:hypothetical protein
MNKSIELFELFVTAHQPYFMAGIDSDRTYFCGRTECGDCIVHHTTHKLGCSVTKKVLKEITKKYPEYMI